MATTVTIDGKSYVLDELPQEAKAGIASLKAVDRRIATAEQELAFLRTARNAYAGAVRRALPEQQVQ